MCVCVCVCVYFCVYVCVFVCVRERESERETEAGARAGSEGHPCEFVPAITSARVFMINTRAQWKLLHTLIILVNIKQHLPQIGRKNGPTAYSSQILAAI